MGLIPEEIIEQIIDRCDIVDVISSYVPLKKAGRNFKTNCPFHNEKTPSFVVNADKQIFHCFGCGVGGNVVSFVMKQERMEFPEAIRHLARRAHVELPEVEKSSSLTSNIRQQIIDINTKTSDYYHKILLSEKSSEVNHAREYLKERKISLETAKAFKLGYALDQWEGLLNYLKDNKVALSLMEKAGLIISRESKEGYYDRFRGRILFPIFDTRGHVRAFGARSLKEDKTAKYINSPETPLYTKGHHLYGFHLAKESIAQEDHVIVVEGYMDCISVVQAGIQNIVASLGTALTNEQIRLIRRYTKNVVMLFDTDSAGESAMMRSLDTLIEEGMNVRVATLKEGEDPDSYIHHFGVKSFKERINNALTLFDYKMQILSSQYDVKTVEGKANIANEMLISISKYENAIMQSGYIKRLAQILNVLEGSLLTELKKVKSGGRSSIDDVKQKHAIKSEAHRVVEFNMLKLMLEEEELIVQTKEAIEVSYFQDAHIRRIVSKIYDLVDQGKHINIGSLVASFDDSQMQKMITEIVADTEEIAGDKKKMHRDFINRIKQDQLKLKKSTLLQEIQEAEVKGNNQRLDELKREFNELVKK